jgi:hypothetical protein
MITQTAQSKTIAHRGSGRMEGTEMLTACHPEAIGYRFLVTLVHARTGEEKAIDLLTDVDSFAGIRAAVRSVYPTQWTIFESLLCEDCF